MKRDCKFVNVLSVIVLMSFVGSDAFLFPLVRRTMRNVHDISDRRPNSFRMNKKEGEEQFDSSPSSDNDKNNPSKQGPSVRRLGGRRNDIPRKQLPSVVPSGVSVFLEKYRKLVIWTASALLLGAIVIGQLFNMMNTRSSFVYYQSSVVESRIVGSDGNIQTSRKETFKSNLPDLVREQQKQSQEQNLNAMDMGMTDSQKALIRSEERRLLEQMNQFESDSARIRELDSSIRADLKLMDDFFY